MEHIYDVLYMDKVVGKVRLIREGLYYNLHCQTKIPGMRLCIHTSGGNIDLGICVPMDGSYGLHTKKSVKSISGDILSFYFCKKQNEHMRLIDPDQPFLDLYRLTEGFLRIERGKHYFQSNQQ